MGDFITYTEHQKQFANLTRCLKPVRDIKFTDQELLAVLLVHMAPDDLASISLLVGSMEGVIRVTFKTKFGIKTLEDVVKRKELCIREVPLAVVGSDGQFVSVIIENVPIFLTEIDVESKMSKYGEIASVEREFLRIRGRNIETEKRTVLYSTVFSYTAIPRRMEIKGNPIFTKYKGQRDPFAEAIEHKMLKTRSALHGDLTPRDRWKLGTLKVIAAEAEKGSLAERKAIREHDEKRKKEKRKQQPNKSAAELASGIRPSF